MKLPLAPLLPALLLPLTAFAEEGWHPWDASPSSLAGNALDLRSLNEAVAGQAGYVQRDGEHFTLAGTGNRLRFWGVNGMPEELSEAQLASCARSLAAHGVNLVRLHGAVFDRKSGAAQPEKAAALRDEIRALKQEGIYSVLSIYFPLWYEPDAAASGLAGYTKGQHPFGLIYFPGPMQEQYRGWWRMLLQDHELAREPAIAALELVNEDSLFFWTFAEKNIPEPQLTLMEQHFGKWLVARDGSLEKTFARWKTKHPRDNAAEVRAGFRQPWSLFNERTVRDQETAAFLLETQERFYQETIEFLRNELGYKGLITTSNWQTANNRVLGPLEKLSYLAGDFVDRHGYYNCNHEGENAAWSIRPGHTFSHRSALRFEPGKPGGSPELPHFILDPMFSGHPSMISETTFCRPNRYRTEAPLLYAAYGALQGTDAVVHFALDGAQWQVKPRFWMQPWTLMSPTQMGQFPAAALIYRLGLLEEGALLLNSALSREQALTLRGSALMPEASLDLLREADVQAGGGSGEAGAGEIDPLVHFAGRTNLDLTGGEEAQEVAQPLERYIDRTTKTVVSSTGQIKLDYGKGLLLLNSPAAQGAVGNLQAGGRIALGNLVIESPMDLGSIVAVAMDGQPLAQSRKVLLQVMSEEMATGFRTEPEGPGVLRIMDIGRDPWLFREIRGTVTLSAMEGAERKITPLDLNGRPVAGGDALAGGKLELRSGVVYYIIEW